MHSIFSTFHRVHKSIRLCAVYRRTTMKVFLYTVFWGIFYSRFEIFLRKNELLLEKALASYESLLYSAVLLRFLLS